MLCDSLHFIPPTTKYFLRHLAFKHVRRLSLGIMTNRRQELKRCKRQRFRDRSGYGIGYVGTLVVFPMVSGFIGHLVSRWSVADQ
jgi:hypothetical protein